MTFNVSLVHIRRQCFCFTFSSSYPLGINSNEAMKAYCQSLPIPWNTSKSKNTSLGIGWLMVLAQQNRNDRSLTFIISLIHLVPSHVRSFVNLRSVRPRWMAIHVLINHNCDTMCAYLRCASTYSHTQTISNDRLGKLPSVAWIDCDSDCVCGNYNYYLFGRNQSHSTHAWPMHTQHNTECPCTTQSSVVVEYSVKCRIWNATLSSFDVVVVRSSVVGGHECIGNRSIWRQDVSLAFGKWQMCLSLSC